MSRFQITMTGTAPLLMHNSRLSDPLDPITKAIKRITDKRKMTDDDHEEKGRLEHQGSLYFDADIGPYIPGENIERCLTDAARITRSGKKIERGLFIETDVNPLAYEGPRDQDGLWADHNFRNRKSVKVTTNRVIRTRPRFGSWAVQATGMIDTSILSLEELVEITEMAGRMIGLGDWRPRFGRFTATIEAMP